MRILALGDIFGRPGRNLIKKHIKALANEHKADFVIANIENASSGSGLTQANFTELEGLPTINAYTSGNHIWDRKEIYNFIQNTDKLLRPANYPEPCPGKGYFIYRLKHLRICVINLSGNVYLNQLDNPFDCFDKIYEKIQNTCDIICIDFHAEATSEKIAFAYYADGRANVVFGTHTHVQTADERILDKGCGYITDIGMCGPYDGVIGVDKDIIIKNFLTQRRSHFEVAAGRTQANGAIFTIDESTLKCTGIERVRKIYD
ncbi:MAG: TIGR00282 family metallophosphoesterase [Eubacteriaceae bacterium]|nr:TIGR00282 family metallophosphoesterase [Eubacteriaceae bacterium]